MLASWIRRPNPEDRINRKPEEQKMQKITQGQKMKRT